MSLKHYVFPPSPRSFKVLAETIGLPVKEYPNIRRWHEGLTGLPGWKQALESPPSNPAHRI